jgi:hypothetical protein
MIKGHVPMDVAPTDDALTEAVKAILNDVHIYKVGDFVTFPSGDIDAPLGWGRIQQNDRIFKGSHFVCNESHETFAYRRRILGYDLGNSQSFAYKLSNPELDNMMHSLPSDTVREMLGIDAKAERSSTEFFDALGNSIQIGDLVSYAHPSGHTIHIGRVINLDAKSHEAGIADLYDSSSTMALFYRSVSLLPTTEAVRAGIHSMTREDFDHLYF